MARNDAMDAIAALMGLGMLGSTLQRQTGGEPEQPKTNHQKMVEGAKAAKEIYNSYITVGFTQEQAYLYSYRVRLVI